MPRGNSRDSGMAPERNGDLIRSMQQRVAGINEIARRTLELERREVMRSINTLSHWMTSASIVRVIAGGRTRLALAIAANRLAHGGARVSVIDDTVPMPSTRRGGAILTASASGENATILRILEEAKRKEPSLIVFGMAGSPTSRLRPYCDLFVKLHEDTSSQEEESVKLRALNDWREQSICILMDAMVAAAGRLAGLDEAAWRSGHEDLGATGPYDQHSPQKEGRDE